MIISVRDLYQDDEEDDSYVDGDGGVVGNLMVILTHVYAWLACTVNYKYRINDKVWEGIEKEKFIKTVQFVVNGNTGH